MMMLAGENTYNAATQATTTTVAPYASCQALLEDGELWIQRVMHAWDLCRPRDALSLELNQGLQLTLLQQGHLVSTAYAQFATGTCAFFCGLTDTHHQQQDSTSIPFAAHRMHSCGLAC
jgi:hypothetical protein